MESKAGEEDGREGAGGVRGGKEAETTEFLTWSNASCNITYPGLNDLRFTATRGTFAGACRRQEGLGKETGEKWRSLHYLAL